LVPAAFIRVIVHIRQGANKARAGLYLARCARFRERSPRRCGPEFTTDKQLFCRIRTFRVARFTPRICGNSNEEHLDNGAVGQLARAAPARGWRHRCHGYYDPTATFIASGKSSGLRNPVNSSADILS
jgi:hypothetical protein